jgi:L-lactate dehydrogenase complex protein LldG
VSGNRESVLGAVKRALGNVETEPPQYVLPEPEKVAARLEEIEEEIRNRKEELIQGLSAEVEALSGKFFRVNSEEEARNCLESIIREKEIYFAVMWNHPLLDALKIEYLLEWLGINILPIHPMNPDPEAQEKGLQFREDIKKAGIGLSAADFVLADSGTIFVRACAGRERSTSLVPHAHVALLKTDQILPGLDDLLPFLQKGLHEKGTLESCLTFITGPSRTADIELTLTLGVHGPKEVYVILIDD